MATFIQTIIWAAIIQGILLGILYLSSRKYSILANRLLGLFLFALVTEALTIFLPFDYVGSYYLNDYFSLPEVKLFFPSLFLHVVLEKIGRTRPYQQIIYLHYAMGFLILSLTLVNLLLFLIGGTTLGQSFSRQTLEHIFLGQQYYAFLLALAAIVIAFRETLRHQRLAKHAFSDATLLDINWLWQFIVLIIPITAMWGVELGRILLGGGGDSMIITANWGLVVIFIYFVSYKTFRHPNLFERSPEHSIPPPRLRPPVDLTPEVEVLTKKLQTHMHDHQSYLNPDLTIFELAKKVDLPSRKISTYLNQNLKQNFSEWVNQYRVEEAKQKLNDPTFSHLSIEGVGLDSGFKSRSAMYAAFKKQTGQSPGHFRKSVLS